MVFAFVCFFKLFFKNRRDGNRSVPPRTPWGVDNLKPASPQRQLRKMSNFGQEWTLNRFMLRGPEERSRSMFAPAQPAGQRGQLADSNGQGSVRLSLTAAHWVAHPTGQISGHAERRPAIRMRHRRGCIDDFAVAHNACPSHLRMKSNALFLDPRARMVSMSTGAELPSSS